MKKTTAVCLLALSALIALPAWAQNAKETAAVGEIHVLDAAAMALQADPYQTIIRKTLRTSQQKRVFVDLSMECGLYTRTLVKSKGNNKDTSTAEASVKVLVYVDGKAAAPGEVTYCKRTQELSASLGGALDNCQDLDGDGHITLDECDLTDEEIELVLDTMGAQSFNFVSPLLDSGDHVIEVKVLISNYAAAGAGEAEAKATLGKGSMTVDEVRLAVGDEIDL